MFDFAVDGRNEGSQPGLNDKGMVTQDRQLKKDVYFFYQANWTTEPMVWIASRRMTPRKLFNICIVSDCRTAPGKARSGNENFPRRRRAGEGGARRFRARRCN